MLFGLVDRFRALEVRNVEDIQKISDLKKKTKHFGTAYSVDTQVALDLLFGLVDRFRALELLRNVEDIQKISDFEKNKTFWNSLLG